MHALQGSNSLSAIGMAAAIAGKYFKSGDLVQSDSLQSMRSWVRPCWPAPVLPCRVSEEACLPRHAALPC